jgi:hypothetical protein
MRRVSLRGLSTGPDPANENRPYFVSERLKEGLWCWVDVWWRDGEFLLGTDEPKWKVKPSFLGIYSILANAKDFQTLLKLNDIRCPHTFMWTGSPILTPFDVVVTDQYIEGYESQTLLLTDDAIYAELPLWGICSDNINDIGTK